MVSSAVGNARVTDGRDLPWLQDVDTNGDGEGDVWTEWGAEWRDVVIVDSDGEVLETINLTSFDLRDPDYYEDMTLTLIEYTPQVEVLAGDCNGDAVVDASDLDCVANIGERDIVLETLDTVAGDLDGDGEVSFTDFLTLSRNFGQQLTSYSSGNIDMEGGIDFSDFLALSRNFGQTSEAAATDAVFGDLIG